MFEQEIVCLDCGVDLSESFAFEPFCYIVADEVTHVRICYDCIEHLLHINDCEDTTTFFAWSLSHWFTSKVITA